jgi:small GTP-binding protein
VRALHARPWDFPLCAAVRATCTTCSLHDSLLSSGAEMWDCAGIEKYRSLTPMYTRGSHVVLAVFDLGSLESLNDARAWLREEYLQQHQPGEAEEGLPREFVLVGNKLDTIIQETDRCISTADGTHVAAQLGAHYLETSAKTGQNVEQILGGIAARRLTCGMQALPTLQTLAWATALLEQPATALCELPLDIIALVATHVHAVRTAFDS